MKLTGKVVYQNLAGGFWGIVADNGQQYRPVQMPEQLKSTGARVEVLIKTLPDVDDIYMWGEVVEVVGFSTL